MRGLLPEELLCRPIMTLAAWSALQPDLPRRPARAEVLRPRRGPGDHPRRPAPARPCVHKLSSDTRKNNTAALACRPRTPPTSSATDINNFVGAAFVGRTQDETAQRDALKLLGKARGDRVRGDARPALARGTGAARTQLGYREFIYRDGLGGDGGRGGMEKIRITLNHHPALFAALDTTADPTKRVAYLARGAAEVRDVDGEVVA